MIEHDDKRLMLEQMDAARNFLRHRLGAGSLGELLDEVRPVATEVAGVSLLKDLIARGLLRRDQTARQAFSTLVFNGPTLIGGKAPA